MICNQALILDLFRYTVEVSRANNFNLLRLLAALQVAAYHVITHFHIVFYGPGRGFFDFATWFPGVPIFFAISGFLIPRSWESNHGTYFKKRFLRIAPGYWVALLVSMITMAALGGLTSKTAHSAAFIKWFTFQLLSIQTPVPLALRHYGVGDPNGSLWTIFVELGFYAAVPILFWLGRKFTEKGFSFFLGGVALISVGLDYSAGDHPSKLILKILGITFIPHIWLFIVGWLIARNMEKLKPLLEGRALFWILGYIVSGLILVRIVPAHVAGQIETAVLPFLVVSCAFTRPNLTSRLIGNTDISYGVYLYHMIVINAFIALGFVGFGLPALMVFGTTIVLACASWWLIERPSLALKAT